jgi:asparagine synthase (glutamine-hydrolysing)
MCGIAGIAGSAQGCDSEIAVRCMVSALARRGPDGQGVESWKTAILGHRRLSIYDLSQAGRQPMLSPDRSIGVVFNGAIYNFVELRNDLSARGYHFQSRTDTEVLIHGYDCYGIEGLVTRLRGMFAIGLWDDRIRKLFLIRDRLGVKPLAFTVRNGNLAFASTVRALRAAGFVSEIDPDAVAEYLEFGYVPDPRTIYREAWKLPAASILEFSEEGIRQRQYFKPAEIARPSPRFEEAVERTEQIFLDAVKLRLAADVPVGALLSGGVDSSLVCWAIAKLGANLKAFTVATRGDPADESADAAATARRLGLDLTVIDAAPEDAPRPETLAAAFPEPFACASALGMLSVSEAVKPHATVLLTGDGGDDCFLGYPEHSHFFLAQRAAQWMPGFVARRWPEWMTHFPKSGPGKRAARFLDYATGGLGAVTRAHDGVQFYHARGLFGERLAETAIHQREIPRSRKSARRLLAEFLDYDRVTRFVGEYMTKVDGATMYHALEARSPFLDQELWNYGSSLDYGLRLRGGKLKAVLREIARRRIGRRVAAGPKRGFTIPVGRWLASRWNSRLQETFAESILCRDGWICRDTLSRELACLQGSAPNQIWYLFVLEHWLRKELAEPPAPAPVSSCRPSLPLVP